MKPIEFIDRYYNSVFISPEAVTLEEREGKEASEEDRRRLRKLPWFGETIRDPEEMWFIIEETEEGQEICLYRYIALFQGEEEGPNEVVVVSAQLIRPGEFKAIAIDLFAEEEFDNDRWRFGIPVYANDLKKPVSGDEGGICWQESLEKGLAGSEMYIVKDIRGESHTLPGFPWDEEEARDFLEMLENREELEDVNEGVNRCLADPDKVVMRPSFDPESGEIIDIHVFYRLNEPEGPGGRKHEYAVVVIDDEGEKEVVDYLELSDSDDWQDMLEGVLLLDKSIDDLPVYIPTPLGYIDSETSEVIDTKTDIVSIENPINPEQDLWAVMIFRHPPDDPPFMVDFLYIDDEEELQNFRKGKLASTIN